MQSEKDIKKGRSKGKRENSIQLYGNVSRSEII